MPAIEPDSLRDAELEAQQALETASRIDDEGNNYFAAMGAEHGRELRAKNSTAD